MSLVFTWAPTRTIDLTRLSYSSFLLVPKGYTSEAHRRYWDYPFRDEQGRVSATLLGRIAKRLAQEGVTETNAIVHRKLEVLVKKSNEEAKKLGGNPSSEWILKQLPGGSVYMNRRTREERSEVPAERRRLEPAVQVPPQRPVAPARSEPRPAAPQAAPAPPTRPASDMARTAAAPGPSSATASERAAPAKNAQGSPPEAGALEGRKRLRKAKVVESDEEEEQAPAAAMDVDAAAGEEEAEEEEESESEEEEEEEADNEGVERVLRKCEKLATKMRAALSAFMQTDAVPAPAGSAAGSPREGAEEGADGADAPAAGCGSVGLCATEARGREGIIPQPPNMSSKLELKPYQLLGLNWLWALHQNGLNGILADEMGLGKTVQLISLLAHLTLTAEAQGERAGPFLIITPTSTAENWARELAVWCPSLVCEKYVGSEAERAQLREHLRAGGRGRAGWDVLITTYSLFERDSSAAKEERSFLNKQRFDYMVLDEAHCIKNSNSARYRNLCRMGARRRLLLTGTPLENSLKELYTLLSFLMPNLIGPHERDELIAASHGSAALDGARRVMAPFVLRRLKRQVLSQLLLPKQELTTHLSMDAQHAQTYDALIDAHAARVRAARAAAAAAEAAAGAAGSGNAELDDLIHGGGGVGGSAEARRGREGAEHARIATLLSADRKWAKHAFTELRKAAQHPLLVRSRYGEEELKRISLVLWKSGHYGEGASHERVAEEVGALSDFKLHELCTQHRVLADLELPADSIRSSAKLRHLAELLPRLRAEGHRVVIFSQWTSLLDILEQLLGDGPAGLNLPFVRFDGSTSADDRQLLIDAFSNSDEIFAFLLTTRAGGVGINLTAADTVILHDVDFNPAIDLQAQDRVHRIGQTRPVTIHRLVTARTVDEKILQLQSRKAELNDRILHGDESSESRLEASICGTILTDLLNERMAPSQLPCLEGVAGAPAADATAEAPAPLAEPLRTAGGLSIAEDAPDAGGAGSAPPRRPPPAHVLAEATGGRANAAGVPAAADALEGAGTAGAAPAQPVFSDAQLLAELGPLVPPADSAEFATLTLKPIKRALIDKLGPAAKLNNEALGKLINTLVEQRRAAGSAEAAFQTRSNSLDVVT